MKDDEIYDDWIRVNEDGFGNNLNRYAWSMAIFKPKGTKKDRLYVGTTSILPRKPKPEIYSSDDPKPKNWDLEFTGDQRGFRKMKVFNNKLYVGTLKDPPFFRWMVFFLGKWGCKLYKYDGKDWIEVIDEGFGSKCHSVRSMEIFKGPTDNKNRLYVGTSNLLNGGQVWRTKNNDPKKQKDWEQINKDGFGKGKINTGVFSLKEYDGYLWAGVANGFTGCEIWRYDGKEWRNMISGGFNTKNNVAAMNMEVFKSKLYLGTFNPKCGCQIWRYPADTPVGWERVVSGGFYNPKNVYIWSMKVYKDKGKEYLYAGTYCDLFTRHGAELWRSSTGDCNDWERIVENGFNDSCNYGIRNLEIFGKHLYAGTARPPVIPGEYPKRARFFSKECQPGCEVWKYPKK